MSSYNGFNRMINILFAVMLISSVTAYAYHALTLLKSGSYALWTYSGAEIDMGIVGKIMVYLKDISAALLTAALSVKNLRCPKILIYFAAVVFYGTIILGLSESFNILFVIGGIRAYLVFIAVLLYFDYRSRNISSVQGGSAAMYLEFDRRCMLVLQGLLVFEFAIVILQILNSGITEIGSGGYRYTGTFGNSGGLGNYGIGMAMLLTAYSVKTNHRHIIIRITEFIMIVFLVWASGSRSSIFMVLLLAAAYMAVYLYEALHISKSSLLPFFIIVCLIAGGSVYSTVIQSVGRGELMRSGSSRIYLFLSLFDQDLFPLFFGQGIGKGTNAAVNLGIEGAYIYDGTFTTIMVQYGFLGLMTFCFAAAGTVLQIIKRSGKNRFAALMLCIPIGLIMITLNYFEQFALVAFSVYAFYIMTAKEYRQY